MAYHTHDAETAALLRLIAFLLVVEICVTAVGSLA